MSVCVCVCVFVYSNDFETSRKETNLFCLPFIVDAHSILLHHLSLSLPLLVYNIMLRLIHYYCVSHIQLVNPEHLCVCLAGRSLGQ